MKLFDKFKKKNVAETKSNLILSMPLFNFAKDYYNDGTKFGEMYGNYASDFCELFNKYETEYHVEDTLENYELIKKSNW